MAAGVLESEHECDRPSPPDADEREADVSKEVHTIKIWAWRGEARGLVCTLDTPKARSLALMRVQELQDDPAVDRIEMREHMVTTEGEDVAGGHRGSLGWERVNGKWRKLRAGHEHLAPHEGSARA